MTRDPERIDRILEELELYWKEHPHLKLSTIMENIRSQSRRDGEMDKRNRIGDLEDIDVQAYLERKNEEREEFDFGKTQQELLEGLVGLYDSVLGDLKDAIDYEEEKDSGLFDEWKKFTGDWRVGLSCPECGHDDYEVDGWCIKCPECGFRSRSERPWK